MKRVLVVTLGLLCLFMVGTVQAYECTGSIFNDVNSSTVGDAFCGIIEEFSTLGITSGCSADPPLYCPFDDVNRAQMAVFLVKLYKMLKPENPVPNFEGEVCFSVTEHIVKFRVSHIGGGNYIVNGKMTVDGILHVIVHGNAVLDGSNIYLTLVQSEKDSEGQGMHTGILYAALDKDTLNGTSEGIRHIRDYSDEPLVSGDIFIEADTVYDTNSVTFIPCP